MAVALSPYLFTYAADAEPREKALAERLYGFLAETYGLSRLRTDAGGFEAGVPEILFGRTRHNDSVYTNRLIREYRYNYGRDFCIRFKLGKLIINAMAIEALEDAVEHVIGLCGPEGLDVPADYSYYHRPDCRAWSPAGVPIVHYRLVTPQDASYIYREAIDDLREAIRTETGATLLVMQDTMPQRRLEIQIGGTNRGGDRPPLAPEAYEIGRCGERIFLRGGSDLATAAAARRLAALLRAGESPTFAETLRGTYTPAADDYRLVFADEFDGGALDGAVWSPRLRVNEAHGGGTCYRTDRPENICVKDGKLVIQGNRLGEKDFQSGYAWSRDKLHFQYGLIEIRARLPRGEGIWPGFWLNAEGLGYRVAPEIDVLEVFGNTPETGLSDTLHCAMHRWAKPENGGHTSLEGLGRQSASVPYGGELADAWHTIGLQWTPEKMVFTFDGRAYFEQDITAPENACFHQPVFIILSMAVGLALIPAPHEGNEWPAVFEVDWIRLYQRPGEGRLLTPETGLEKVDREG